MTEPDIGIAAGADRIRQTSAMASRAQLTDAWVWADLHDETRKNYSFVEGAYPLFATRAKGSYIWDVDGNRYIDYSMGYGTVVLGHADDEVTTAVIQELKLGHCLSPLWKPSQVALTELLVSVIPGAEMAFLMKTGSDATTGAVRLARVFTGRNKVIRWGYNGWHDWCTPRPQGVPASTRSDILEFAYNDLDSLRQAFERHRGEIACVIMMPFELTPPQPGVLEEIRTIAHQHGALFVLDEMRSGFRLSLGGAQEFFGVRADLATYSKSMANGYAVSAIVGRADVLRGVAKTKMTATYFASSDAMSAAIATISKLKSGDAIAHIWRVGTLFQQGLRCLIGEYDIAAEVLGYPPFPFLSFTNSDLAKRNAEKLTFYRTVVQLGILFHPNHHWYISASHSESDVEQTLAACRVALEAAAISHEE